MSAIPQVPPRPSRTQDKALATSAGGNLMGPDMPKIPPRPANRRVERSQSPHRESFARSPFNEIPPNLEKKKKSSSIYSLGSENPSSSDLPHRPASVVLPSIGQEGSEYDEAFEAPDASSPQTRSVANDLKLHAPKPSLPQSSAKQRVSTVTRTDSDQAAALGYGKAGSESANPSNHSLKSKSSITSINSSHGIERRPSSSHGQHDDSIPEIGLRVPMYRDAGDVQAPSPKPSAAAIYAPGVGFHNDGSQKTRHHGRRLSGKGLDLPPGSYGLHGHGVIPHDKFEKAYYEKHPELIQKECGQYGGAIGDSRGEFVLSSEDLNKLVRETASRGSGLGTSSSAIGTPSEQVGFQASEEYTSRMSSPHPQSIYQNKTHSNASQSRIDSPLRKESAPLDAQDVSASLGRTLQAPSEHALESDVEDDTTIHVDEPSRRMNKIYGGAGHMESTESLGHGEHTEEGNGYTDEHGYSAPILASDEVAKEPFASWEMQPAVFPTKDREGNYGPDSAAHHRSGSASSISSRRSSRPTSIHGGIPGMRDSHSTPLEDLDEYEPLFPDDDKSKPTTAADRLKRPELKNRKFPSQDIWEDTPTSLQYTATVSTPQVPEEAEEGSVMKSLKVRENETPAQAFARKQEELAESESSDPGSFLNPEKKAWVKHAAIPAHIAQETRPSMKQRFPSRDIWEDSPDSLQLQTTVSGPQTPDADVPSPVATTGVAPSMPPHIPARPIKTKLPELGGDAPPPFVPERPAQKRNIIPPAFAAKPSIPERPKPSVPARSSKLARETSQEGLTRVTSAGSSKSQSSESEPASTQAASKPKPPVPSRPVGSKIAALQGGFMSDLNKRLQLGPMGPKKEEPKPTEEEVQEKAPLSDARKGRARGPARRAPAKSAAPAVITTALPETVAEKLSSLGFSIPTIQWSINLKDGSLTMIPQSTKDEVSQVTESPAATLATNTSDEGPAEVASEAEKSLTATMHPDDAYSIKPEASHEEPANLSNEGLTVTPSAGKLSDSPPISIQRESPVEEDGNDDEMTASTVTVKPLVESTEEAPEAIEHEAKTVPSAGESIETEHEVIRQEVTDGHKEVDAVAASEVMKDN